MLQSLLTGLVQGSIYAIIALGYTMVYGILVLINFAHGEVLMVGAYASVLVYAALTFAGTTASLGVLPCLAVALLAAMGVAGLYGFSLERIAYRPLRHAPSLSPLISAIGMSIFLQNYVRLAQGSAPVYFPAHTAEYGAVFGETNNIQVGPVLVTPLDLFILVLCLLLMAGLYAFVHRTRLGKAMRATSMDKTMAGLVGISVDRVISVTFVIGSVLAAVAGMLLALYTTQAKFDMGFMAGMKAFTAAVLGGIGNLRGAMLGGILLGLAESVGIQFLGADYKEVYAFVVLLLVLVVRPRGILGERVAEKV
ncbi:MAG: branched-chain amino acid ABC transporter permease [Planctomycetaceae bacterium]|nr:branched-chain amino acid ABC transporter permease [Planctomycetota bacterium]NUN51797.1 branched-chain amino acid ABC transporter permease [Planctomycetaceae bacterium]